MFYFIIICTYFFLHVIVIEAGNNTIPMKTISGLEDNCLNSEEELMYLVI